MLLINGAKLRHFFRLAISFQGFFVCNRKEMCNLAPAIDKNTDYDKAIFRSCTCSADGIECL